ncbi:hypothetical protein [Marinoscillum sp. 108]|jgi:hypothetical protein|uniref:Uncharacterized protein n=1 Tax=Marinoscillum luteum TaxID=861051 RepID=A0ABW7NEE8_9BACT|nr:hypothetical protein [Marinoscillum sp. 108]
MKWTKLITLLMIISLLTYLMEMERRLRDIISPQVETISLQLEAPVTHLLAAQ